MPDAGHQGGWGVGATTAPPNPFNVAKPPPIVNPFAKPSPNPFLQTRESSALAAPSNPFSGLGTATNPFSSTSSASLERWASSSLSQTTKSAPNAHNPFEPAKPEIPASSLQPPKPSINIHQSSLGSNFNGPRRVAEFVQPAWPDESKKVTTGIPAPASLNKQKGGLGAQSNGHNGWHSHMPTASSGALNQPVNTHDGRSRELASKIQQQLAQDRIKPPKWPANPGSHAQRQAMENFRESYKAYREKARKSLIRAGLIDDPDQRRTLQQALDFRGISDEMCPEWEKITRIIEYDIRNPEKAADESGDLVAIPSLMVKRLARSAAGQDAPLPMDVRSFATLRKTLDYLIDDLIPNDSLLPSKHNFLWDRTRAIRIDLSVQKYNLTPDERTDLIYCLETIARFHVTALHLLSQDGFAAEDFSEQQEVEQLGKTLISLKELYDDCIEQNIECPNEAEFRGYYIVFNARNPSIKETVEGWPARLWNTDGIRTAMCLVESLQNTWSLQGPLNPYAPTELALSAAGIFFSIVASPQISYTMACFAEIHFNDVRKSMLQILRKSYTRPREGPKDITPALLQARMRFDTEDEAVDFAQKHGIVFGQDGLQRYAILNSRQSIEDPRIRHAFSRNIVERKRSDRSLPDVIHQTVFDMSSDDAISMSSQGDSLFVADQSHNASSGISNGFVLSSQAESLPSTIPSSSSVVSNSRLPNGTNSPWSQPLAPPNSDANQPAPTPQISVASPISVSTSALAQGSKYQTTSSLSTQPYIPPPGLNPGSTSSSGQRSQATTNTTTLNQGSLGNATTAPDTSTDSVFSSLNQPKAPDKEESTTQADNTSTKPSLFSDINGSARLPAAATAEPSPAHTQSKLVPNHGPSFEQLIPKLDTNASKFPPKSSLNILPAKQGSNAKEPLSPGELPPIKSKLERGESTAAQMMPSVITPKRNPMEDFTRWFVLADQGLLEDELQSLAVGQILKSVWKDFQAIEEARIRQEEDEKSWAEALKFRHYSLKVTYFYRWLDITRKRRIIKRIQLEKEKARKWKSPKLVAEREAAEASKRERDIEEAKELVGKRTKEHERETRMRESTQSQQSLEEALLATGVFSGVRDERAAARDAARNDNFDATSDIFPAEKLRLRSENQRRRKRGLPPLKRYPEAHASREGSKTAMLRAISSGTGRDTLSLSTGSLRHSTFSSSYRSSLGFNQSRISKPRPNVSDPYWRMKANGLVQMPNGEYLHETLALPMLREGKRYPGLGDYGLPPETSFTPSASPPTRLISGTDAGSPTAAESLESDRTGRSPSVIDGATQKRKRGQAEDDDLIAYRNEAPTGRKRAKSNDHYCATDPSSDQDFLDSIDILLGKVDAAAKSSAM
ncbi:hypothetical protein F5B22DRAFT_633554 [Xylaria bambusicola]|uniref:uncharacterized protein n=1 Tax=Xylaria bambusicola TaxID=326684 RepID=UPI00200731FC|nr:uncharacterized protein F5B22DRAFT_633554 [Xylaria bambusicola]KAI0525440.1 hypothetical protein F5B22DRAFT_633554 [Xylaria bambusicola]